MSSKLGIFGGVKKWKKESTFSFFCTVRICPAFLPLPRCCFVVMVYVTHFSGDFHSISHPLTDLRIGSSADSRLGTSYCFVSTVFVMYSLGANVNFNVNPVPSAWSSHSIFCSCSKSSMSPSPIVSAMGPMLDSAPNQKCGTPTMSSSSSSSSSLSAASIATSMSPCTTCCRLSYSGWYNPWYFCSNCARSLRYSSTMRVRSASNSLSLAMRAITAGGRSSIGSPLTAAAANAALSSSSSLSSMSSMSSSSSCITFSICAAAYA
mmetsp:Transcript_20871/g.58045  ORF Transcript_20871/g.58045 Transcript_20871/m.58045 type:complete len:264 (-) Transcript_20871:183-974(-)